MRNRETFQTIILQLLTFELPATSMHKHEGFVQVSDVHDGQCDLSKVLISE